MSHKKCKVEGCCLEGSKSKNGTLYLIKGFCRVHYNRMHKYGRLDLLDKSPYKCKVEDCQKTSDCGNFSNGYCRAHYVRTLTGCSLDKPIRVIDKNNRTGHKLFSLYKIMCQRCNIKSIQEYSNYGGRGIKVCDRWLGVNGFINFLSDMGDRPTPNHSLDRIDVNGDYEPSNCRWATKHEQASNTRKSKDIVGVNKCKNKWRAYLKVNKKYVLMQSFYNKEDAIKARLDAEIKFLGKNVKKNI